MNIQEVAQEKLALLVENGTVEQIIENNIKKTVESTIHDIFRDYSDFGKSLKETLTQKMQVNLDNINVEAYSNVINKTIESALMGTSLTTSIKAVQEQVNSILEVIEKKEWKLSEIITKYKHDNYSSYNVTYNVEDVRYSNYWVNIGNKDDSRYGTQTYKLRMLVDAKSNEIHNVWYDNKPIDIFKVNKMYQFEMFLMQLWINKCKLIVDDEYDCDEACERESECRC